VIFDYWNSKNIVVHRKLTDKITRKISSILQNYTEDEVKKAIDHYETILHDDAYYWSYTWTFEEFLQRGIDKFLTDACFQNYKANDDKKQYNPFEGGKNNVQRINPNDPFFEE